MTWSENGPSRHCCCFWWAEGRVLHILKDFHIDLWHSFCLWDLVLWGKLLRNILNCFIPLHFPQWWGLLAKLFTSQQPSNGASLLLPASHTQKHGSQQWNWGQEPVTSSPWGDHMLRWATPASRVFRGSVLPKCEAVGQPPTVLCLLFDQWSDNPENGLGLCCRHLFGLFSGSPLSLTS